MSGIALIRGVNLFVRSATKLAHNLNISEYTISFFLIAIGTSLPETTVAITSAIEKKPLLALGNSIGSNIALLTLVVALPALTSGILTTKKILESNDIYYTALFNLLPIGLIVDGKLTRLDGIILLVSYSIYAQMVLKKAHGLENIRERTENINGLKQILVFLFSLAVLLISSEVIVRSGINLSSTFAINLGFIGLTVTALGTSLPEIAFSISALKNGSKDEILGNIIGSVVANSTLVLGLAAIISPINLNGTRIGMPTLFFLVLSQLVFLRFAKTKEKFDKPEGLILLLIYILFLLTEIYIVSH